MRHFLALLLHMEMSISFTSNLLMYHLPENLHILVKQGSLNHNNIPVHNIILHLTTSLKELQVLHLQNLRR